RRGGGGAERVAGVVEDEGEGEAEAEVGAQTRLLIGGVEGAPGDGGQSLPRAITEVLKRQDIVIVSDPEAKADLVLDADVVIAKPKGGKQNVKIVVRLGPTYGSARRNGGHEQERQPRR